MKSAIDPTRDKILQVGIVMHSGQEHMRQVALGIANYTQLHPQWQIASDGFHPLTAWSTIRDWRGDGLVAIVNSHEQVATLKSLDVPFVLAGSRIIGDDIPVVASDNYAIGKMAAEHLVECGFRNLVFFGQTKWDDERIRYQGFRETLAECKLDCQYCDVELDEYLVRDHSAHYRTNVKKLHDNLAVFERPFGIFCPNSVLARGLVEAYNRAHIRIPDEVGIIGVNNDTLECESIHPTISTVVQQSQRIGFRSIELLNDIVSGTRQPEHVFLEPEGVIVRRSTDVMLVDDPSVEQAMRFMRDHAARGIGIEDVVAAVGISRRSLEVKFRQVLNRTPLAELNRIRIDNAKKLLRYTDQSITTIALQSGFGSSQSFCVAFKKACGCSPSDYRQPH